jgi:transcriptional regulator with XRE-family HTH domain/tetratricopeptide (TPR) repeat protein
VSESREIGETIGCQLRRLRRLRGLTQEELADRANVSRDLVAKLEQGRRRTARLSSLASFARALDVELSALLERAMPVLETEDSEVAGPVAPGDMPELSLALGGCDPPDAVAVVEGLIDEDVALSLTSIAHLVHEWLVVELPQLAELRAGRRIGSGLVDRVERRVEQLRYIDDFVGGRDLHDLVARELRVTIGLLKSAAYSDESGRRLLIAVGELCQLAGWVASDAGLRSAAQRHYLAAMRAADGAGDRPLAAQAISSLAYQAASGDDPRTAVVLARSAYEGARGTATATTQALLLERVAWAHARAGELTQTERALDAVDSAFEERRPAEDPPWVYWLDRDEIDVMAGRCYTELRRPAEAVPLLSGVLERYGDSRAREAALYTSWLTESHLQAGEIDRAGETAFRALEFADRVNSARTDERLAYLHRTLGPHRAVATVREFDEHYRSDRGLSD